MPELGQDLSVFPIFLVAVAAVHVAASTCPNKSTKLEVSAVHSKHRHSSAESLESGRKPTEIHEVEVQLLNKCRGNYSSIHTRCRHINTVVHSIWQDRLDAIEANKIPDVRQHGATVQWHVPSVRHSS